MLYGVIIFDDLNQIEDMIIADVSYAEAHQVLESALECPSREGYPELVQTHAQYQ